MPSDTLILYLIMMKLKFERRSDEINEEIIKKQNYWNQYLGRGPKSQKLYRLKPKMASSDTSVVRIINWQIKLLNTWTRFNAFKKQVRKRVVLKNHEEHNRPWFQRQRFHGGKWVVEINEQLKATLILSFCRFISPW